MKIFLIGWFGAGNMGDEAILIAELLFFKARIPNARFFVLSFDPEKTKTLTAGIPGVEKILRMGAKSNVVKSDFSGILRAFRESDLVLIGGGGIFQDLYNSYPIPFFAAMVLLARLNKKPVVLYSVGIGPVNTFWGKKLCRYAVGASDFVSVRDAESAALLREFGVSGNIELTADPVFMLSPVPGENVDAVIDTHIGPGDSPVVGVCIQELLAWDAKNRRVLADVLDALVGETGARIVFLPLGLYRDRWFNRGGSAEPVDVLASRKLAGLMREKASIVSVELDPRELLAVIRRMDLVLSMRLHGLIMATAVGVPVVALTYSEESKLTSLMKRLGQEGRLFDVRKLDKEALSAAINDLLSGKDDTRERLSKEIASLRSQVAECNERLLAGFIRNAVAEA